MDNAHALPNNLAECQQLLLVAFQQAAELSRVLDEMAASYEELQGTAWYNEALGEGFAHPRGEIQRISPHRHLLT